ncbi:MAG: 4'-phosphopantetheinyl transferase family protein, partial [Flexibacteraceae bacterium]
ELSEANQVIDLQTDFVHIYISSIAKTDFSNVYLTELEKVKCNRFIHQADKDRFTLGRYLTRSILPKYIPDLPPLFELSVTETNKPYLPNTEVQFNLAHSGEVVVLSVSNKPIGIDIEHIKPIKDMADVMQVCFNEQEINSINSSSNPQFRFYEFWTRKEAILKATGEGIATNLLALNVLEGTQTYKTDLWDSDSMHLNTFNYKSEYLFSTATVQNIRPCIKVLE